MNRRSFLTSALALSGGLLVPEWLLDPPKGRSMVSVPGMPKEMPGAYAYIEYVTLTGPDGSTVTWVPTPGPRAVNPIWVRA